MLEDFDIQRIARLTPLADVLASFDLSIRPVAPREEALANAVGMTLAADVAGRGRPSAGDAGAARRFRPALRADDSTPAPMRRRRSSARRCASTPAKPCRTARTRSRRSTRCRRAARPPKRSPWSRRAKARWRPTPTRPPASSFACRARALRRIDVALLASFGVERVMVRQPRVRVVCASPGANVKSAARLHRQRHRRRQRRSGHRRR